MDKKVDSRASSSLSFRERMNDFIENTDIRILVYSPSLFAFGMLLIWAFIIEKFISIENFQKLTPCVLFLLPMITGLSGLMQIIRREAPGPMGKHFRGIFPVVTGAIFLAFAWTMGLLYLLFSIY